MRIQDVMGGIEIGSSPPSAGRDIFAQYAKGEITFVEYTTAMGVLTADSAHDYHPRRTPQMDAETARYVENRIMGQGEYQERLCRNLSDWFNIALRVYDQNDADVRTLRWAKEKCEIARLVEHAERAERKAAEFESAPFPTELFKHASRVLRMDSEHRQRMTRGSS